MISVGIITVSDRVFRGEYEDKSGPALKQFCEKRGWQVLPKRSFPTKKLSSATRRRNWRIPAR